MKKYFGWILAALIGLFILLAAFGAVKIVDWRIGKQYAQLNIPDMDMPGVTIRTLDLYPYDGFHVQAHATHKGPMYWEYTSAFFGAEVTTGDKGYFINFDLDNPPAKATNEFRIVLFGGSGAQGWGATSQDKMFYSLLERELSVQHPELKIRVINMAMGSSTAYQNFISLNLFGHKLQPDLMLAYVGRNDYVVPLMESRGTDWYCYSGDIQAFAMATRGYDTPPNLKWLAALMPNMMKKTTTGVGLKLAYGMDYYRNAAALSYSRTRNLSVNSAQEVIDKIAVPQLCRALIGIRKDFDGVPMLVAWQGISHELSDPRNPPGDFYNQMFQQVVNEVSPEVDRKWFFLNVHDFGVKHHPQNIPSLFSTHLNDQTHPILAAILAKAIDQIIPVIRQ